MNKLCTILLLALPLLLWGGNLSLSVDLSLPASSRDLELQGWGSLSAPGYPQLPYKTINVILPPAAEELSFSYNWSGRRPQTCPLRNATEPFWVENACWTAPPAKPGQDRCTIWARDAGAT